MRRSVSTPAIPSSTNLLRPSTSSSVFSELRGPTYRNNASPTSRVGTPYLGGESSAALPTPMAIYGRELGRVPLQGAWSPPPFDPRPHQRPLSSMERQRSQERLRTPTSSSSSRLSLMSVLSQQQALELRDATKHASQRATSLQNFHSKRAASLQKALNRGESFPNKRKQAERHAAFVRRRCAAALQEPITFLPPMPEAAALARRKGGWAHDSSPTRETASHLDEATGHAENVAMVEELTDSLAMMSDVLGTWKKPGQERRLIGNLKGLSKAGKGLSPQPTHFKRVSMFSVTNKDIELEEALYGAPGPANVPAPAPTFAETEAAKNIQKNYRMYLAEAPAPSSHY